MKTTKFIIDRNDYMHGFSTHQKEGLPIFLNNMKTIFTTDKKILIEPSYKSNKYNDVLKEVEINISDNVKFYGKIIEYREEKGDEDNENIYHMYIESKTNNYTLYELGSAIYQSYQTDNLNRKRRNKTDLFGEFSYVYKIEITDEENEYGSYFGHTLNDTGYRGTSFKLFL